MERGVLEEPGNLPARAAACWECGADTRGAAFCAACGRIQPVGREVDHFTLLGLPRRLALDGAELERRFHALSRRFHPDLYRMASPRERRIALENASALNQACRALRDPYSRAGYLLELEGGASREGGRAPQALFDRILEVQELLADWRFADPEEREGMGAALAEHHARLRSEQESLGRALTGELFARWDSLPEEAGAAGREEVLERIRETLESRAYLRRVLDGLAGALGEEETG